MIWLRRLADAFFGPFDSFFNAIPLEAARWFAVALLIVPVLACWLLPSDFVFRGAPDRSRWRDLRIWATVIILPYVAIYLAF